LADILLPLDSFVRLAPGIQLAAGPDHGRFVVHYGAMPCGEIDVAPQDHDIRDALAALATRDWLRVAELAGAARFDALAEVLASFLELEWLQVTSAPTARRPTRAATLGAVVEDMAAAAAAALALDDAAPLADALLDIGAAWRHRSVSEPPPWSGLTLDITPFEFSVNFDASGARLRAVGEPQSCDASVGGYWQAAMSTAEKLEAAGRADLACLDAVQELFAPRDPSVRFAAFFGVGLGLEGDRPRFKVYLSPSAGARGDEAHLLGHAAKRLGLGAGWDRIRAVRDDHLWTLACLDLEAAPKMRFKVYETLLDADESIDRLEGSTNGHSIEHLAQMLTEALPPSVRGFKWGMLSHTLSRGGELTHTFGVALCPGAPQGQVRQRIEALLARVGLDPSPYTRCFRGLAAACDEPLEHSYVTVQRVAGLPRVTTYLAPRLYQSRFGVFEVPAWPSPVPSFAHR
jgi:hypothetical protein